MDIETGFEIGLAVGLFGLPVLGLYGIKRYLDRLDARAKWWGLG